MFSLLSSVVLSICFAIACFLGNQLTERMNEDVIQRTYDQLGQISTLISSLGANLTYERNEFGELLNFKARQGVAENHFVSEHQYDSLGFELECMFPGGISQSFAYDNIGSSSTARHVSRPRYAENVYSRPLNSRLSFVIQ